MFVLKLSGIQKQFCVVLFYFALFQTYYLCNAFPQILAIKSKNLVTFGENIIATTKMQKKILPFIQILR